MSLTRNIFHQVDRPVGQTTLRRLLKAFTIFIIPIILFAYIAEQVFDGDSLRIDDGILMSIYQYSSPALNQYVLILTSIGGVGFVLGLTALLCGFLVMREKWQAVTQVAFGVLGAGCINFVLKILFERDRPNLWQHIVNETSYSFPSGHAMLSSALAFSVVAILWHTKWRWPAIILGGIYVIIIGLTRLYLGVHYPTDVFAGWLVSFAWVILVGVVLGAVNLTRVVDAIKRRFISQ